jgi:hypothetical protein
MMSELGREVYTSASGLDYTLYHRRDERGDYWTGGSGDGKWMWGGQYRFASRDEAIQYIRDMERVEAASAPPADTREAYEDACASAGITPKSDVEIQRMAYALTYFDISILEHGADQVIEANLARKRLQTIQAERQAVEAATKARRQSDAAARRLALIEQAKATGKPVRLAYWQEECNDPNEECDLDDVTEWAMPDGSTRIERSHNW